LPLELKNSIAIAGSYMEAFGDSAGGLGGPEGFVKSRSLIQSTFARMR
jgi:hypothetical protein